MTKVRATLASDFWPFLDDRPRDLHYGSFGVDTREPVDMWVRKRPDVRRGAPQEMAGFISSVLIRKLALLKSSTWPLVVSKKGSEAFAGSSMWVGRRTSDIPEVRTDTVIAELLFLAPRQRVNLCAPRGPSGSPVARGAARVPSAASSSRLGSLVSRPLS